MPRSTSRKAKASPKAPASRKAPASPMAAAPPKATAVQVVPAQPTDADRDAIARLGAETNRTLPGAAYLVLVKLKAIPPATSEGWALYVGDLRIPKYWEYKDGIYFRVFDPQFFAEHKGERLRFTQDEQKFIDTGLKLAAPSSVSTRASAKAQKLPRQEDVLKK
jgi:hypothetical protein